MRIYRIDQNEQAIAEVQRYLRAVSYHYEDIPHIGVDGIYGIETQNAVRAFQVLFSLRETGIVDFSTFAKLYNEFLLMKR